ncbi:hypothetical protein [Granulibacter bethesdensis]|uniref:Uncharacterized protein n=2 Tax=Granulibacter bethesdensis TaxID=364410 RepID=Q0BT26_GRABC|nr:hypothetical protein [Granulibacter bethesdensis]ABI62026.1 Hypothetical protein GbCGDNIH1_1128 [Granulibacter bethesdensis CGDNIH1]AHJ62955.1 Hypothetical protein GbCGDNIH3_1128 [Granulibacter bethesdensis]AHJ66473.1 Hypothetical protein GbCGDNIH4_1128 [Granulibacter bethesdensis CGDNIH4]AHJ69078.1 Hypothetical protein GbCGDNIH2_1128 [Granulibacter bethesdensis]APH51847.1 Hypothetical protein GbCGDNIH5_1128 [Granulibacter bethesdensis]
MTPQTSDLIAALLATAAAVSGTSEDVVMERYHRFLLRLEGKDPNHRDAGKAQDLD